MIAVERYLRLGFAKGGRERPLVDCWGLYRLIVGESRGHWLGEFSGTVAPRTIARTARREAAQGEWLEIRPGQERPFDAVLMAGLIGEGAVVHSAPIHVGCVIEPGRLIDIEEGTGVMVRAYRNTSRFRASPAVANRVRGIFRPLVLA